VLKTEPDSIVATDSSENALIRAIGTRDTKGFGSHWLAQQILAQAKVARELVFSVWSDTCCDSCAKQRSEPLIHIRNLLAADASDIEGSLKKELGSSATVELEDYGYGDGGRLWSAKTALATIEVTPWEGRVEEVMVFFNPPVRDCATALSYLDIQPCTQLPTFTSRIVQKWDYVFDGIYEVIACYGWTGGQRCKQVTIIPSKKLYDDWNK
jgi:hypothetical protein